MVIEHLNFENRKNVYLKSYFQYFKALTVTIKENIYICVFRLAQTWLLHLPFYSNIGINATAWCSVYWRAAFKNISALLCGIYWRDAFDRINTVCTNYLLLYLSIKNRFLNFSLFFPKGFYNHPYFNHFRCWENTLEKAKIDKVLHDKLLSGLQFSDEMQELLRREVVQRGCTERLYVH